MKEEGESQEALLPLKQHMQVAFTEGEPPGSGRKQGEAGEPQRVGWASPGTPHLPACSHTACSMGLGLQPQGRAASSCQWQGFGRR